MQASGQDSKGLPRLGRAARRNLALAARYTNAVARRVDRWLAPRLAGRKAIEVATIVVLVGGVLMVVAEFLDVFRVESVSGATIDSSSGGANHGYALLVIGLAVLGAVFLARSTQQRIPALAAAGLGVIALCIVLVGDLPDATSAGLTASHRIGEAHPATGFWVELIAALMVIGSSAAIAWGPPGPLDYQR